ncbi:hypothetical protein RHMOL_Rhmol10G0243000 [Rhododendron molle]|uniref:Uncharacterized protein n=1 Tax=Rhododendron molle TaxID=49168 RepID=A0ACC0M5G0_RHOML|nr:hypothetical protein RHMOL_Rhmol10G0243000 [Rhododendron molle]
METLALSQVRPIIPSASFPHLSGHHFPSSLTLSRRRTLRCSALSSRSLGGGADNDHSAKFREAAEHGDLVPLYQTILSDHLTPVLAYRCLVKEDERDAPSFLFESVDPAGLHQTSGLGRYSVIGAQPSMEIVAKGNMVTIMDHREGRRTEEFVEDPMVVPQRIMDKWKPQRLDELPEAFCGGWVGYFSYDTVFYVEKKKLPFLGAPEDDRNLPDVHLGLYDDVIVFDHVEKKAFVIHWVQLDQFSSVDEAFNDGMNRLNTLVSRVPDDRVPLGADSIRLSTNFFGPSLKESTVTSEAYKEAVLQAKEHILAGDIFQILASQQFERTTFADPFEVYRALRIVNPSPYMTYLQARGCILVASSSEILARTEEVTGESLDHLTCWDALRAALPVGTVSGVPKVKAMEFIDEIEVTRRGPYSGGFGSISYSGDVDIALALMTIVFPTGVRPDTIYKDANKRRDWVAHLQAGASIVADNNPGDEQRECENKAAALARAIDLAESSFVADSDPGDEQRECEEKAKTFARAIDLAESSFDADSDSCDPGDEQRECEERDKALVRAIDLADWSWSDRGSVLCTSTVLCTLGAVGLCIGGFRSHIGNRWLGSSIVEMRSEPSDAMLAACKLWVQVGFRY